MNNLDWLDINDIAIGLYFPMLYKKNITSLDLFHSNRENLLKKTREMIKDKNWINTNNIVDTMYGIYNKRRDEIEYVSSGISSVRISIGDGFGYTLPIENIFKILNASVECPVVKYNPGKSHENIYRLFSDKKTFSGDKIDRKSVV